MRIALVGTGALLCLYALSTVATAAGVLLFLLAVVLLHDLVFLPAVLAAGCLIRRWVPPRRQPAARFAGVVGLAVVVVALPMVLGFGRSADNPTVLPRPYGQGLILIVGLVVMSVVLGRKGIERSRGRRRRSRSG
ncbi:hypothetical protein ACTI_45050 [Actinoplanes sp. OR16]|uniref:hypothetical protein n=1 Tax=Actinoplanes sp. OR16 TaxID=946334 RepID=UPI000F6FD184|nr:hypothetical protein [Actinoplanes sp. OR16]BBH67820.1 hypothetical protein ACTI_45050 [Actinoplanes sp. OR16]